MRVHINKQLKHLLQIGIQLKKKFGLALDFQVLSRLSILTAYFPPTP